jgi:hypothetical protein
MAWSHDSWNVGASFTMSYTTLANAGSAALSILDSSPVTAGTSPALSHWSTYASEDISCFRNSIAASTFFESLLTEK